MLATVLFGGMRSITFAQAFQFWLKLTALLVPVAFLLLAWHGDGSPHQASGEPATAREPRPSCQVTRRTEVEVPAATTYLVRGAGRRPARSTARPRCRRAGTGSAPARR